MNIFVYHTILKSNVIKIVRCSVRCKGQKNVRKTFPYMVASSITEFTIRQTSAGSRLDDQYMRGIFARRKNNALLFSKILNLPVKKENICKLTYEKIVLNYCDEIRLKERIFPLSHLSQKWCDKNVMCSVGCKGQNVRKTFTYTVDSSIEVIQHAANLG